jgi:predicted NAD/FAD-binding protein
MADKTALTYNMNILQKISSSHTFCVSVNANSLAYPISAQSIRSRPIINRVFNGTSSTNGESISNRPLVRMLESVTAIRSCAGGVCK